jgi:hypothetical protein
MRLHMDVSDDNVTLDLDVLKIEVEKSGYELDDDGVYETYHRTIRVITADHQAIELHCTASVEDAVELKHVKKLKPVKKPKQLNPDWLIPKVYKGKWTDEEEAENLS